MPIITGIVPSPDTPGHVVILVDGAPFATVPAVAAERLALAPGAPAEAARVVGPLDRAAQRTYDRALNVLGYRERSERDLRRRLLDKGEPPELVDLAIARLRATGLLDDARFAAQKARLGVGGRARAPRRVGYELARRGVARDVADAAVARAMTEEGADEPAIALRAAEKKLRALAHLPPPERRQKLYAFLARQGFGPAAVRRAVDTALAALASGGGRATGGECEPAEADDADPFDAGVAADDGFDDAAFDAARDDAESDGS